LAFSYSCVAKAGQFRHQSAPSAFQFHRQSAAKASRGISQFTIIGANITILVHAVCWLGSPGVFCVKRIPCLHHVICFGLHVFAGACHVRLGDPIRKHRQGSLCSIMRKVVFVAVALLPKISAEARDQMSKDVAIASQRVCSCESDGNTLCWGGVRSHFRLLRPRPGG
jgi:hypothetical protein